MTDLILIFVLVLSGWYWWDNIWSKEIARKVAKQMCEKSYVQFLDDTVEKKKIWLRRNELGRLQLCRMYFFEFAVDGGRRYKGYVVLLGKQVGDSDMEAVVTS